MEINIGWPFFVWAGGAILFVVLLLSLLLKDWWNGNDEALGDIGPTFLIAFVWPLVLVALMMFLIGLFWYWISNARDAHVARRRLQRSCRNNL